MVTVYSKPNCSQCVATKKFMEQKGIEFQVKDVTKDEAAFAQVSKLGYKQMPVVEVSNDAHWSGFQPDRISSLVKPL